MEAKIQSTNGRTQEGGREGAHLAAASFVELGVIAMQGVRRARIRPGDRVVVLGQGLVGQLCIQMARWAGGTPVIAVARSRDLAAVSQASGADEVVALHRLIWC